MLIQIIKCKQYKLSIIQRQDNQKMRKVFGRGLNISGQIDSSLINYPKFVHIPVLDQHPIKNIGCGYMQTFYLLANGHVAKTGYNVESLTSSRNFTLYRLSPMIFRMIQEIQKAGIQLGLFSNYFGFRVLNNVSSENLTLFERAVFSHANIFAFTKDNDLYSLGDNFFGQRALGKMGAQNMSGFRIVQDVSQKINCIDMLAIQNPKARVRGQIINQNFQKIVDVALGFQHTLLLTEEGVVFGCGKATDYQIQPYDLHENTQVIIQPQFTTPVLVYGKRKVIKMAAGYKHTILLTEQGKLLGIGLNKYGQLGHNPVQNNHLHKIKQIKFQYMEGEYIVDIKAGSNHTLILTNKFLYFMGATNINQNPFAKFKQNVSSPTVMDFPSRPIKIFTSFDRTAVITQDGRLFLFGGKDMKKMGGESGQLQIVQQFSFNQNSLVGLGSAHTIIYP